MLFPAMKKEVHLKFIKRMGVACLLAGVLCLGGAFFVEYRRVEQSVVDGAVKEGKIYYSLFLDYFEGDRNTDTAELEKRLVAALNLTPYLYLEFFSPDRKLITRVGDKKGSDANQLFINKGLVMIPSAGRLVYKILSSERVLLKITLPVMNGDQVLTGYMSGVYQLPAADMKAVVNRFALTGAITSGAVLCCGIFCYLGFFLLNNRLVRTINGLSGCNIFLLKKLGTALGKSDCLDDGHSSRLLIYSINLAIASGVPGNQIRELIIGSCLHDIEMLSVPVSILHKDAPLSRDERSLVDKHAKEGFDAVKKIKWIVNGARMVRHHHEKYDGSGYPDGLKHEKIPLNARIFTIADTFDAMTSSRPYRKPLSIEEALRQLGQGSGKHFDPVLLSTFMKIVPGLFARLDDMGLSDLEKEADKLVRRYIGL